MHFLTLSFTCSRSVPQPSDSHWSNNSVCMRLPPGGVPASYPPHMSPVCEVSLACSQSILCRYVLTRSLACSRSVPQPIDSHWSNNPVRMRLPPAGVPASHPQTKLPVLDNPALFEKLDTEALFFAFYYMPGTHQQYLAARELKRQSWRYHKQHGAWFQVQ